ncbi:alanine racemase [Staphylococcus sp. SQ8-PEA]|uniref:Alanine racemase n=1 Tax=Staphylococcus marylandisciuri TaxID=2981529 RepID=A0ABT2QMA9_9STAP|nr:alanine racemase [Staphylococcus marylandisciuri]MCU5745110.1 alanine racemase [Staphylococcus marylandisciuri]
MAHVEINLSKIQYNALVIGKTLARHHIHFTPVLKCVASDSRIVSKLNEIGLTHFAESRIDNISRYDETENSFTMLRATSQDDLELLVQKCTMSIQTELATIREINEIARKQGVKHQILLMVDWKDGREGVLTYDLINYVREIINMHYINLQGLAFNFMCLSDIAPDENDVKMMTDLIEAVESDTQYRFRLISGGNSSMLPLLMYRDLERINELRIGESLFRGIETTTEGKIASLYQNCITLKAEIIEIKPRININSNEKYLQAILDIGRLDTTIDELAPLNDDITIVGATSDQLMVDLKAQDCYQLGDDIQFGLGYSALSHTMFSHHLKKVYVEDSGIEAINQHLNHRSCTSLN